MEIFEIKEVPERGTVAPHMVVAVAVKKGDKSTFAVKWALDQLMSAGQTLILLHVRPRLLTIPTPMGNVPISQVQGDAVAAYMQEVNSQTNVLFSRYGRLCNANKVKTLFAAVEEDDVASAIIKQISNYGIGILVMGSSSSNALVRKFKGFDVPATVAKNAPNFCTVYTISKNKSISVRKATCTESKIGNPEDSSHHSNGFSDTNNFSFPRTGGTESELERFKALAVTQTRQVKGEIDVMPPNHFICPILQEVMDDPHFAADGFTYEHSIIKAWLKNKNTSPMTNLPLSHKCLLPNHSLRSAILDWKVKSGFNTSDL